MFRKKKLKKQLEFLFKDETEFRGWLRSKHPGEVVGKTILPMSCPIAQWINEVALKDRESIVVGLYDFDISGGGDIFYWNLYFNMPEWAFRVIKNVDKNSSRGTLVFAAEIDRMLDNV